MAWLTVSWTASLKKEILLRESETYQNRLYNHPPNPIETKKENGRTYHRCTACANKPLVTRSDNIKKHIVGIHYPPNLNKPYNCPYSIKTKNGTFESCPYSAVVEADIAKHIHYVHENSETATVSNRKQFRDKLSFTFRILFFS